MKYVNWDETPPPDFLGQFKCPCGFATSVVKAKNVNGKPVAEKQEDICEQCGERMQQFVDYYDITDTEALIDSLTDEMLVTGGSLYEEALPRRIWERLGRMIPQERRLEAARALIEAFLGD